MHVAAVSRSPIGFGVVNPEKSSRLGEMHLHYAIYACLVGGSFVFAGRGLISAINQKLNYNKLTELIN